MDILVTELAHRHFGADVAAAAPGARLLRLQADGGLLDAEGRPVAPDGADVEVAWVSTDVFRAEVTRPFLRAVLGAPNLRWAHSAAAGVDAPVFARIVDKGARLTTTHVQAVSIAEYVVGLVLAHFQDHARWWQGQAARSWDRHRFREVHGGTWVVVGLGAIGSAVAVRARAFGATVLGVRRTPRGDEPVDEVVALADLPAVLPRADVVVLAAPATREARGLVDRHFLAALSPRAVLVSVGRGEAVDEAALLDSLDRGVPERAILDVFATEPLPPDHPLWAHPRVWVTPHTSGAGEGNLARGRDLFVENLRRYLDGRPLLEEVDPASVAEQQTG